MRLLLSLFLAVSLCSSAVAASAKSGGWGGSRSSSFSSSKPSSSSRSSSWGGSKSSSWGSSATAARSSPSVSSSKPSKPSSSSSGWGTSWTSKSSQSSKPVAASKPSPQASSSSSWGKSASRTDVWKSDKLSATDRALADKAKQSGTSFQSRGVAEEKFRQNYQNKFISKYQSEPARRPDYVPRTTVINNQSYTVIYDRTYGGYGYWNNGVWAYYDALHDAAMLSVLMNRHDYYYPGSAAYVESPTTVYVHDSEWEAFFLVTLSLVLLALALAYFVSRGHARS